MKISKTVRWILTIGILAILLGGLGINYARQMAEQSRLTTDTAQAHQDFIKYTAQYTAQKEDLEPRLNKANSSIAALQDEFESPTKSIEINTNLFEAAEDVNVTITKLSSSLPEEEELNDITYRVFTLRITAEGEMVALLNFIDKLSDKFLSSSISSVGITVSEDKSSLSLRLKVYAYGGE